MCTEKSLKIHFGIVGVILVFEGLAFLICPHFTMKLLYLSPLQTAQAEQLTRVIGLVIITIGNYYCVAAYYFLIGFFRVSTTGRLLTLPAISAMVFFYSIEAPFLLFGVQDLITASWSFICLKAYDEDQSRLRS